MKVGIRKPSIKKSVKARTTGRIERAAKGAVNPFYGKKGVGWIKDPKRAAYNAVYHRTTVGVRDIYSGVRKANQVKDEPGYYEDNYMVEEGMRFDEFVPDRLTDAIDVERIKRNTGSADSLYVDEIDLETGRGIDYDALPYDAYAFFVDNQVSNPLVYKDQIPDAVLLQADLGSEDITAYSAALFKRHPDLMYFKDEQGDGGWIRSTYLARANDIYHGREQNGNENSEARIDSDAYTRMYDEKPGQFKAIRIIWHVLLVLFCILLLAGFAGPYWGMIVICALGIAASIAALRKTKAVIRAKQPLQTKKRQDNNSFER